MWICYTNRPESMPMKTNKWILLLVLIFCRCVHNSLIVVEEVTDNNLTISVYACFPDVNDKYIYPIVPGMKEWQQLESTDDAYKLCQLPDEVLKTISTIGLIDALIHAPMFTGFSMLSGNASALKWYGHYEQFNSAKELFQQTCNEIQIDLVGAMAKED